MKNKWIVVLLNITIVSVLFLVLSPVYDLLHYINQLFYISFFYLFIGITMWVIRGGFFDGITYGFRRFTSKMSKQSDYLDDWKERPLPSHTISKSFPNFLLFQGALLSFCVVALLIIYYSA